MSEECICHGNHYIYVDEEKTQTIPCPYCTSSDDAPKEDGED